MNQKPIVAALCSYGMSGRVFHAPFLDINPGFILKGAFERSKKAIAEQYPGTTSYDTLEAMLADDEIELVVVNTPNASHFDYSKKALLAGKHIVVEKPFVTTVAEAEELISIANERNLKIAVFQNRRFDSDFLTVKDVIESKKLGDIKEAEFHFDRFNLQLSPKLHKENPGPGAGVVYDLGPHIIDQALYLFGMPKAVFGDIMQMRPTTQVEDYFEIVLYYPDKRVRLKAGYVYKEPIPSYMVFGTRGSFLKSRGDVQEAMLQAGRKPNELDYGIEPPSEQGIVHIELADGTSEKNLVSTRHGSYIEYFDSVYKAIRENAAMPVSATEGFNVIKIIEAAYKSSSEKCVIDL